MLLKWMFVTLLQCIYTKPVGLFEFVDWKNVKHTTSLHHYIDAFIHTNTKRINNTKKPNKYNFICVLDMERKMFQTLNFILEPAPKPITEEPLTQNITSVVYSVNLLPQ